MTKLRQAQRKRARLEASRKPKRRKPELMRPSMMPGSVDIMAALMLGMVGRRMVR